MANEFGEFLKEYLPDIKRIARVMRARFKSNVPLEDLTQLGVIGAYHASTTYDESRGASVRTWVKRKATWEILQGVRDEAQQTRQQVQLGELVDRIESIEEPLDHKGGRALTDALVSAALNTYVVVDATSEAPAHDPEVALLVKERKEKIIDAIGSLPTGQRMVAELRYLARLSNRDIAQRCKLSESTVSENLGYAEKNMAKKLLKSGLA